MTTTEDFTTLCADCDEPAVVNLLAGYAVYGFCEQHRWVHQLNPTGGTACGIDDHRAHRTSPYGSDVTCESCRDSWTPATRAAIDRIIAERGV